MAAADFPNPPLSESLPRTHRRVPPSARALTAPLLQNIFFFFFNGAVGAPEWKKKNKGGHV